MYSACKSPAPEDTRPNIILIMADDMGYSDLGCYGSEIHTPNLDSLGFNGVRFTQFYNSSKSFPSRASLLTGLYSHQVGMGKKPALLTRNCVTIAEVLKKAGYRTLMSGKWHGDDLPVNIGFDRYYGLCDGAVNFWNPGEQRPGEPMPGRKQFMYPRKWAIDSTVYRPYTPEDSNFYITDAFTDWALKFLDEYNNEEKPYFLYMAYTAPHYPLHAWPEDIAKYKGRYMIGWDSLRLQRFERIKQLGLFDDDIQLPPRDPECPPWDEVENKDEWELKMAVYAAMVDRMDQNIGRLLQKVKELGEEDNTVIMFLSDNGACAEEANYTPDIPPGPVESYRSVDLPWANASNTPFRKFKNYDFEGGICTPFILYHPGFDEKAGAITPEPGHLIDLMATCIDLGKATYPGKFEGEEIQPLEGKSLMPVLENGERDGHDYIYWQWQNSCGIRKGNWKLVGFIDQPWELYNLQDDRSELVNLAAEQPELVIELDSMYNSWALKTGARVKELN
ncbi:MAG: arylsulfatase [Bacteroidota bacterium]